MALTTEDQRRIWRGLMRHWSNLREPVGNLNKHDLFDAVEATDDWIEASQGSFNQALPSVARNALTPEQKTLLFCVVALARVSIAFLRSIVGEVD